MRKRNQFLLGIMGIITFLALTVGCDGLDGSQNNDTSSIDAITEDEALTELRSFVNSINPNISEPVRGVDTEFRTEAEVLPDIETAFPIVLEGTNQITAEIFVSPEKAGTGMDGLFITLAESFNSQNLEINGQTVSVSIRDISSGVGLDYIVSGIHIPDGFSPSNAVWGQLMAANNINFNTVAHRTVGDVSGLVMRENIYNNMIDNHGEVTFESLIDVVENDGILFGYANPFAQWEVQL